MRDKYLWRDGNTLDANEFVGYRFFNFKTKSDGFFHPLHQHIMFMYQYARFMHRQRPHADQSHHGVPQQRTATSQTKPIKGTSSLAPPEIVHAVPFAGICE
jgi:hypothetical protein